MLTSDIAIALVGGIFFNYTFIEQRLFYILAIIDNRYTKYKNVSFPETISGKGITCL